MSDEEFMDFEVTEEEGNASDEVIEMELRELADLREAQIQRAFPELVNRFSPDELPDGLGEELEGALEAFLGHFLNGRPLPTQSQEADLHAAKAALLSGDEGLYNFHMDFAVEEL